MQVLSGGAKRDIIEVLEDLLEQARRGELQCVGMVWAQDGDDGGIKFNNSWGTDDDYKHSFVTLVAAIEVMKHEMIGDM